MVRFRGRWARTLPYLLEPNNSEVFMRTLTQHTLPYRYHCQIGKLQPGAVRNLVATLKARAPPRQLRSARVSRTSRPQVPPSKLERMSAYLENNRALPFAHFEIELLERYPQAQHVGVEGAHPIAAQVFLLTHRAGDDLVLPT